MEKKTGNKEERLGENMEKYVITIGREFGSRGREIGEKLGEALGIPVYDKEVIEQAGKTMGTGRKTYLYSDKLVQQKLEGYYGQYINYNSEIMAQMFEGQCQAIESLAEKESCIFIGRCADYVLKDYKNSLHIFIFAPYSDRYYHLLNEFGLTKEETIKMLKQVDRARHEYYKHFTGQNRGAREGKHLMIDSSMFGVEGTVEILKHAVEERFLKPKKMK